MTTLLSQMNFNWNNYELSFGNPSNNELKLDPAAVAIAINYCSIKSGASDSQINGNDYVFLQPIFWLDISRTASSLVAANKLSGLMESVYDFISMMKSNGVQTFVGFALCPERDGSGKIKGVGKYWVALLSVRQIGDSRISAQAVSKYRAKISKM